ncbi:MAG TPA: T9SS type A sorting domain-containing protein, partial [Bacteroidales bacterium]|nr:T9SS type A sorting domain-containing protein [Bacteroidales bacterium]
NYKVKIISSGEHCNAKFSDVACITVVNNTGKAAADNYNPSESETIQQNNDGLFKRSEISLFPNPTNEIINIKALVEQEGDYCIEVLDILGFSVYMGTFVSSDGEVSVSINLNQYPSAMYVVRITGKDTKLVARFIKN